jgi:hypothetical protein
LPGVDDEEKMELAVTTPIDRLWGECSWTARDLATETRPSQLPVRAASEPASPSYVEELHDGTQQGLPIFRWLLATQAA